MALSLKPGHILLEVMEVTCLMSRHKGKMEEPVLSWLPEVFCEHVTGFG
jgi:hypothetical protein